MGVLETSFMTNPVNFLRVTTLSPPDGVAGDVLKQWQVDNDRNIESGGDPGNNTAISLRSAGAVRQWATFKHHALFPKCKTVVLSNVPPPVSRDLRAAANRAPDPRQRPAIPIWWLPWKSKSLVRMRIPPVPPALINADEDEHPRFFMTAGINGCSVIIEGPPESPTIVHAGIESKLKRPSDEFWLEQLEISKGAWGHSGKKIHAAHKRDYMGAELPEVKRFLQWKNGDKPGPFRLEFLNSFGSLIGVRFGRAWSFYVQKNVYVQEIEVLKRKDVTAQFGRFDGKKFYTDNATGQRVDRVDTTQKVSLGKLTVGSKTVKTFHRMVSQTTAVVGVGEVFPSRQFNADFRDEINARS